MKVLLVCAAAFVLAACSTPSTPNAASSQSSAKPMEEREYRTGSRIPTRDPSAQSATTSGTTKTN